MSRPTQRNPRVGFFLAFGTALLWGFLALALTLLLRRMDGYTVTWYRMLGAGVLLGGFQAWRGQLPNLRQLTRGDWVLVLIGLFGLLANYVLFILSLEYVDPATAQLVVQIAPIAFLLGGLVVFRERFSHLQWIGLGLLIVGMPIFFNERLPDLLTLSGKEGIGVVMVAIGALTWAAYGLAQKALLKKLSSENILLLIYLGSAIVLLPTIRPQDAFHLDRFGLALLAFGIFNTLAAYGAFAEALDHWEASRVSAVISLTPLVTVIAVYAAIRWWPEANLGTPLSPLSWVGALVVVAGSVLAALGRSGADSAS